MWFLLVWLLLGQAPAPGERVRPPSLPRGEHLGLYLGPGTLEVREGMDGLVIVLDGTLYRLRHSEDELFEYDSPQGPRKVQFTGRTVEIEGRGTFRRP